jgi:perosamine synthetase
VAHKPPAVTDAFPKPRVSMSAPDVGDAEREAVAAVLRTPHLSGGSRVIAFEQTIAAYVGSRHAIAVSSGTAALHLGLAAAGVGHDDLVFTSPFSFVASANVIMYQRAIPIFVDIDSETLNLDPDQLAAAVTDLAFGGNGRGQWLPPSERTSGRGEHAGRLAALLPVDVFGQPADLGPIASIAERHGLPIVEDACEAIGAEYLNVRVGSSVDRWVAGSVRHAACFAFYPNKQMTTGEGGMLVTDDDEWAALVRALRNQGRAVGDTWLRHSHVGFNYRMDELRASLGLVQAQRLDELLIRRQRVADLYDRHLAGCDAVTPLRLAPTTTRMSWFVYVIRLDDRVDRDRMIERLEQRGIPSRPYFLPIHLQSPYRERFGYREGMFPNAEAAGRQLLALPFSGVMSEEDIQIVCHDLSAELGLL